MPLGYGRFGASFSVCTRKSRSLQSPNLQTVKKQRCCFSISVTMELSAENLPQIASISPSVLSFLNATFQPTQDLLGLSESTRLVRELEDQCSQFSQLLSDLMQRLDASLLSYASFSDRVGASFNKSNSEFEDLKSKLSPFCTTDRREEKMVVEELATLAKEVARVEMVRNYAETALKLDSLVGEIEDAVSSVMNKKVKKHSIPQSSEELLVTAIDSLKSIEDVLASVKKTHPQWLRLVSAADHRVDRALATLRPQAIADHRALLASFGWPPPLSTLSSSNLDTRRRPTDMSNPLSEMRGELKKKYCESFIALCRLQELQRRRKGRLLEGYNRHIALHQPLWAIEELVNPLFLESHHHLKSWITKPEFVFALVYKLIRDYIDSIDELLQPLVDEAMLTGYSCQEEWISSMVTSLTTYLAKDVFPEYITPLTEDSVTEVQLQSRMSWLHIIDLMVSFDKRIQALSSQSGLLVSAEDYSLLQRMSCLSVFSDRPDWLDVWAEIELGSILDILKAEIEDERNWTTKTHGGVPLLGSEDYKSPGISSLFLLHVSSVIDRCRSLPTIFLRSRFIRLVGAPVIHSLLNTLLTKCLEAEGLTALADDDALARVMTSINCARHIESMLKEWCEDVFFLEMGLKQDDQSGKPFSENGVFDDEIRKMEEFRKEWIDKMTNVILRGFDSQIRDYLKNRKQWQEKLEEGWTVTKSFIVALDYLQGKISIIEQALNAMDFATVWRSLTHGIDRLIYTGVLMGSIKFSRGGVERFEGDMYVLFGVFRRWCLRPEGFFPHVSEGLKLLKMEENHLQNLFKQGEEWMKHNGIRHLSLTEGEKIARSRVFL